MQEKPYFSKKECTDILAEKWPRLKSLLPVKWYFAESPLRKWLTYHEDLAYEIPITYLEEELVVIQERFPSSFKKWVGSLGVKGSFWSKRFESMVIFLLLRAGVSVESIHPTIPRSKKELDIKIEDKNETLFIECTSLRLDGENRGTITEMTAKTFLNNLQRKMKQLVNYPGQKIVMMDGSFHPETFLANPQGFKEEIQKVLNMDKLESITFVTLSIMDIFSPNRMIGTSAFAAPWGNVTPLVKDVLVACQFEKDEMRVLDLE